MLTKRLIPCLDIDKGRVVKGVSFKNIRDAGDPVELAAFYDKSGADELVFLDITASSEDRNTMVDVVKNISEKIFIPFTVGGGIRSIADIQKMLEAGADKVSINTAAIENENLINKSSSFFGNQCIVVAIDFKKISPDKPLHKNNSSNPELATTTNSIWEIYTHGGRNPTGIDAINWAHYAASMGAGELLVTSMDYDGQKSGYDIDFLNVLSKTIQVPIIASGGAGTLQHLVDAITLGHADAVLAASIFHFGIYSIEEAKVHMENSGIPIRPINNK